MSMNVLLRVFVHVIGGSTSNSDGVKNIDVVVNCHFAKRVVYLNYT